MSTLDVLRPVTFGQRVAEEEGEQLAAYFVETDHWHRLLEDAVDVASGPSLARQVIEIVAPQVRIGGFVMNDNGEPDYMQFMGNPENAFLSVTLPIKRGTALSVKVS